MEWEYGLCGVPVNIRCHFCRLSILDHATPELTNKLVDFHAPYAMLLHIYAKPISEKAMRT